MNLDDFVRALNLGEEDLNDLGLGSQALLPTRRNCCCPTQKRLKNGVNAYGKISIPIKFPKL
jgi:hypothetical protein